MVDEHEAAAAMAISLTGRTARPGVVPSRRVGGLRGRLIERSG